MQSHPLVRAVSVALPVALSGIGIQTNAAARQSSSAPLEHAPPILPIALDGSGAPSVSPGARPAAMAVDHGGGGRVAATMLLWDQPPANPYVTAITEGEEPAAGSLDVYLTHDVVFSDAVKLRSITTWFTDVSQTWVGGITLARLNIFDGGPPLPGDDPRMGTYVSVTAVIEGGHVRLEALVDVDLAAGAYRIGVTPIRNPLSMVGVESHIESRVVMGEETLLRNPLGGLGVGTDWGHPSDLLNTAVFEGSIRIEGSLLPVCPDSCAPSFYQEPDLSDAAGSDPDLSRSVAENCVLRQTTELCEVVVWGTYAAGQTPPTSDLFTLIIHADAGGLPGPVVYSESGIASSRVSTGETILSGPSEEYRYTLTPAVPVVLPPATYWFEVFNDTSSDADDNWYWEHGERDFDSGIPGAALAGQAPGITWNSLGRRLAMEVCGQVMFLEECPGDCGASVYQPTDLLGGYSSDPNPAGGSPQSHADDFVLAEQTEICEITVRGVYGVNNTPSVPDDFTVIVYGDLSGNPGSVLFAETGVNVVRTATGSDLLGLYTEYEYVLTPSSTWMLDAGNYWLEVFNDTTGDPNDVWFWSTGTVDDPTSIRGHVLSNQPPTAVWYSAPDDMAFRICGRPVDPCVSFCASLPNATGSPALLTCSGDPNTSLALTSSPVPNTPGLFFFGSTMLAGGSNLGDGLRCVSGNVRRMYPFIGAGMMMQLPNTASVTVDYNAPYATALTGTVYFQHWFRSGLSTGTGSNTSDAVAITF